MEPLLTAAGYTRADGVWQKEGRPLALTFVAPNNNADRLAAAETLAANLTDAGLAVELRALAWDDYLQALTAGEFDLYLGEVRLTADFDLTAFLTPGGALNYGKYSDAEALNRLSAFRAAVGQWRTEPARQLYEYLAGQPPFAVICFKNWSRAHPVEPDRRADARPAKHIPSIFRLEDHIRERKRVWGTYFAVMWRRSPALPWRRSICLESCATPWA